MAETIIDPTWLRRTAEANGFLQDSFERAWRLAALLAEVSRDSYLSGRVVLKGGTAINFFHADLPRLSVDVDLNYTGAIGRESMMAERETLQESLRAVAKSQRYEIDDVVEEHANWTVRFLYRNAHGSRDSIKADVNFLSRLCLYPTEAKALPAIFEIDSPPIRVLAAEEAFGGKLKALATRGEPRDVFDAAHLFSGSVAYDRAKLRKAFLFFAYMDDATLQTVNLATAEALDDQAFNDRLRPLLRRGRNLGRAALIGEVIPPLKRMLRLTGPERQFGLKLEAGLYEPALLFGRVPVETRIQDHPAAEWRRRNPHTRAAVEG